MDSFQYTNLLVVETRGECEHAGAWIQWEYIVCPVGDEHIAQMAVGPLGVGVGRDNLTNATASWHVLRNIKRIGRALEGRRIVVGVGDLRIVFEILY